MKKDKKIALTGILTAIGASLCCVTPVLAVISGASGVASTFSWLEPFRPYLISITLLVLAYAWYRILKPKKEVDCACEEKSTSAFTKGKTFLGLVTFFAITMLAFPYYSGIFFQNDVPKTIIVQSQNIQTLTVDIEGMTCNACEQHVNHAVNQLEGIVQIQSSYKEANSNIQFDSTSVNVKDILKAIESTGYKITQSTLK